MKWSVYDNQADDLIGYWNDLNDAESFLQENASVEDQWEVFPYDELLLPVK